VREHNVSGKEAIHAMSTHSEKAIPQYSCQTSSPVEKYIHMA
jgi:hypothetical protein